eukprot:g1517.t1
MKILEALRESSECKAENASSSGVAFKTGLAEYFDEEAIKTARDRRAQVLEFVKTIPKPSRTKQPSPTKRKTANRKKQSDASYLLRSTDRVVRPGLPQELTRLELHYPNRESPPLRGDDSSGHLIYHCGENLSKRFKILSKLGQGKFGIVLECWDRVTQDYVAVKVVRNRELYREAALSELQVLHTLELNDLDGRRNCISSRSWFYYRHHVCLVFQRYGPNLWQVLESLDYEPLNYSLVYKFGKQMLEGLAYIHELSIIHTDLKTENILLTTEDLEGQNEAESSIKIIDFGSAIFEEDYHPQIITTRDYRAPEVILELGWSYPCDMWSMGCMFFEMATGLPLFITKDDLEHLAMMEQVLGTIPEALVRKCGKRTRKFFFRERLNWPRGPCADTMVANVRKLTKLKYMIQELADKSMHERISPFLDLVKGLLEFNPEKRLTAKEALQHPFFTQLPH